MQSALVYFRSRARGMIAALHALRSSCALLPPHSIFAGLHGGRKSVPLAVLGVAALTLFGVVSYSFAGQERYEYDPIGRLIRYVDTSDQVTEYSYDAAGNILSVIKGGSAGAYVPSLTAITPNFIRRGEAKAVTLTGQRLQVGTLQTSDAALDLSNLRQSNTQILADLTAGLTAAVGAQTLTFANAEGSAAIGITVGPQLPGLSVEPSPLALPPDNVARPITLRLSGPDLVGHQVAIASSDTAKLTVSSASIVLAAGQTSVQVNVTSKVAGFVNLALTSATLAPVTVPVFITSDFRGVNTSYSMPVGVMVGEAQPPATSPSTIGTFISPRVGVAVGAVLTEVQPQALPVGGSSSLVIRGAGIPSAAQVSVVPATGVVLGAPVISADGLQITAPISIDASAGIGTRRVVVTDGVASIPFADSSKSQIVLTTGQPTIASIEPMFATSNTTVQLKVRGTHLQNGRLAISPAVDLRIDTQPVISADGTELSTYVQIAALAAMGSRTVQVVTPSGQTAAQASGANQFSLVSEIKSAITPIFAQPVGVVVGSVAPAPTTQIVSPITAPSVGVAVGAYAQAMAPRVAVVGTSVNLVVNGQGLQTVQAAGVIASTGLTVGAFTVNAEGTQLTLPLTVDASAPKTLRRLILSTANGPLNFIDPAQANFLVAAPVPELISIAPQVVKASQSVEMTLRGKNFRDIAAIRFEPSSGLTALQPFTASADGTQLTFTVQAAANAASGARTLVVVAAGGESSSVQTPANTIYVAQQTGPTYADIMAQSVGVQVGATTTVPTASTLDVYASAVGVVVESVPTPVTSDRLVAAANVGVIVGTGVTAMSPAKPDGILKGSTGNLVFTGVGLDQAASARVTGSAAITLGALAVNPAGTELTLPVAADAAVASGIYGISLYAGTGAAAIKISSVNPDTHAFSIGALPSLIQSVAPIVLEQGKSYAFTVRGEGLRDVYQLIAEPAAGINFGFDANSVQWSSDALGEKLTVQVLISNDAFVGSRVIRLRVPGGITDAVPVPANTITIVAPQ